MKPGWQVAILHKDIREGRFQIHVACSLLVFLFLLNLIFFNLCFNFAYANSRVDFGTDVRVDDDISSFAQKTPSIAMDPNNGNIYVVWEDARNGNCDIYFSKSMNSDNSFSENMRISDDMLSSDQRAPSIAVSRDGSIFVVWEDERAGRWDIYFTHSTDGGLTWSKNMPLDPACDDVSDQLNPSVALGREVLC